MSKVPSCSEILVVYNVSKNYSDVATKFGWAVGYAEFMVKQAIRNYIPPTVTSPVVASPAPVVAPAVHVPNQAVLAEAVQQFSEYVVTMEDDAETKELKEMLAAEENKPIAENQATVNVEDKQTAGVLPINIDASSMLAETLKGYINREVDDVVESFCKLKRNIVLVGDSGTGKTTLVEQYAARKQRPFLRASCDETTSLKTLLGTKEIINGTTYFRTGVLLALIQMPSVILFDEFNALHASKLFFLHELLDNRRVFVQDADGGKVIKVHPECQIFLACNPANKNYGGTNKMNAALGNRTTVIDVPTININEMASLFECGKYTENLKQFYLEASKIIYDRNLRVAFSLRNIQRAAEAIKAGMKPILALRYDFYNAALLTASEVERDIFEGIALRIFGR